MRAVHLALGLSALLSGCGASGPKTVEASSVSKKTFKACGMKQESLDVIKRGHSEMMIKIFQAMLIYGREFEVDGKEFLPVISDDVDDLFHEITVETNEENIPDYVVHVLRFSPTRDCDIGVITSSLKLDKTMMPFDHTLTVQIK